MPQPIKVKRGDVFLLEDMDLVWSPVKLKDLAFLWNEGHDLKTLAKYFNRSTDETFIALFHLARQEKIAARSIGRL
jgi:hypothetical protein